MHTSTFIDSLPFIKNTGFFVDFFFVLSGFIIASTYRDRFINGYPILKYMILRFGRIYPLHFVILLIYVAIESYTFFMGINSVGQVRQSTIFGLIPFNTGERSFGAIISNLFLTHCWFNQPSFTWNGPSWSISAEFYMYLFFAIAISLVYKKSKSKFNSLLVTLPFTILAIIIYKFIPYNETGKGVIRCLWAFPIGVAIFYIYERLKFMNVLLFLNFRFATIIEIVSVFLVIIGVSLISNFIILGLIFGFTVLTFAFEGGALSKFLGKRIFALLGELSYSIYMLHSLVILILEVIVINIQNRFNINCFKISQLENIKILIFGINPAQGFIAIAISFSLIIFLSSLTYRYIETPSRNFFRKIANQIFNKEVNY